jgi:hypothetical protein
VAAVGAFPRVPSSAESRGSLPRTWNKTLRLGLGGHGGTAFPPTLCPFHLLLATEVVHFWPGTRSRQDFCGEPIQSSQIHKSATAAPLQGNLKVRSCLTSQS